MEITWNQDTGTIDIIVPQDQISDELLGILPPPTATTAEGCLAWSIGFSDAFRPPRASSSSTGVTGDELLGTVGAIVGVTASEGRASSVEAEGKIRGTLILTFNNSPIAEESASTTIGTIRTTFPTSEPLPTIKRLQDEFALELSAPESQPISLGSSSVQARSGLNPVTGGLWFSPEVGVSNMPTRLFANPFS